MTQNSEIRSKVQDEILAYIAREIIRDESRTIDVDESIISSGLIDSFHLVDLALFVEDSFQVRIEDSDLSASVFDSVRALVDLIVQRSQNEV